MAAVTNVLAKSVRVDLVNSLALADRISADIERGWGLVSRYSTCGQPATILTDELREFVNEAEEAYALFTPNTYFIDAGCESLLDVVRDVLRKLWDFLCKLWDTIKHCFNYLFNTQYRAASGFVKCQQKIALLDTNDEARDKWMRYTSGGFVTPDEGKDIVTKTDKIVAMLEGITDQKDATSVDAYAKQGCINCGIAYTDGKFIDTFSSLPLHNGTYGGLGWDPATAIDFIKSLIDVAGRGVKLKKYVGSLESDMNSIRRKINSTLAGGASSADLQELQTALVYKTKMFKVVQAGIAVLNNRIAAFDALMAEMAYDAGLILNGEVQG